MYWGASVEFQTPLFFLPKEIGIKVAAFADAGSLWDYKGPTVVARDRRSTLVTADRRARPTTCSIRSSVGVGLIWDRRSVRCASISPIPLTKQHVTTGRRSSASAAERKF